MGITFTNRPPVEVGSRFGKLTVAHIPAVVPQQDKYDARIPCVCDCGERHTVTLRALCYGISTQCKFCGGTKKHGDSTTNGKRTGKRLYRIWLTLKNRCVPNSRTKASYYDRGIAVCEEWSRDYVAFRDWALANGYRDDLSIDRTNNDGPYSPENCRWATPKEQTRNTRKNLHVTAFGETKVAIEWLEDPRCVFTARHVLYSRLKSGWLPEDAISIPVGGKNPNRKRRPPPANLIKNAR